MNENRTELSNSFEGRLDHLASLSKCAETTGAFSMTAQILISEIAQGTLDLDFLRRLREAIEIQEAWLLSERKGLVNEIAFQSVGFGWLS